MSEALQLEDRVAQQGARPWGRRDVWACVALLCVNAIWLLTLRLPFIHLDDPWYIVQNPYVRNGLSWESMGWAFTTSFGDYWHPLTWMSWSLDSTLFGTEAWGYHLTNAVLHVANAVLVYLFFRSATGATWRSLLAAALFSVHPERVESVAWVTERKDVLAGFFGLLALLAYLRFVRAEEAKRAAWYLAVCGLFVCSMLAKPMLVTFPALLLLLDFWPLGRWSGETAWRLVREKVLLFLLAFAGAVNTYMYVLAKGSFRGSAATGVGNAAINYSLYLRDFLWPAWLSLFYRARADLPWEEVMGATGLLLGMTLIVGIALRQRWPGAKAFAMGWLWFGLAMVPTSGLLQPGYSMRGDRFMYLPTLGLIVMGVWGILPTANRRTIVIVGCAGALGLAACTIDRLLLWQDPLLLYRHDLALDPENAYLQEAVGLAAQARHFDAEAAAHFREAARLDPFDFIAGPESQPARLAN